MERKYRVEERKNELRKQFETVFGFPPQTVTPIRVRSVFRLGDLIDEKDRIRDLLSAANVGLIRENTTDIADIVFVVRYAIDDDKKQAGIIEDDDGDYCSS